MAGVVNVIRWRRIRRNSTRAAALILALCAFATAHLTWADSGRDLRSAVSKLREYRAGVWRHTPDGPAGLERCATPYFRAAFRDRRLLSTNERGELAKSFQRPYQPGGGPWPTAAPLDKVLLTPHFKFWYTLTGPDAPPDEDVSPANGVPDYVDVMADAYERAWDFEIETMGFRRPLSDYWTPNNGGDERLDVFLFNAPFLGVTVPEWYDRLLATSVTAAPWFGMNSRMYSFFGKEEGKRYIETTAAHEFLHSSQEAYNAQLPAWIAEASATWMESRLYDGGVVDDGDIYDDGDFDGETDGVDQIYQQLRQWFLHPDTALSYGGGHAYGNVIFMNYLTERFGYDFIREIYEEYTEGGNREFGNFWDLLATRGTNWAETFKTFTIWNYFTGDRAELFDGYRDAARYPPIGIHPQDRRTTYPALQLYDEHAIPSAMSSRYVVFEPPPGGIPGKFSVKIRGASVQDLIDAGGLLDFTDGQPDPSFYRQWLEIVGLRGWAAPLIIEKTNGDIELDEIFTYSLSQEGQADFEGFGTDIRRIVLILINIRPDAEEPGNFVSYAAGAKPGGVLSNLAATPLETGGVQLNWQLEDLTDIREVYVIRKRYSPFNGDAAAININFQSGDEVIHAGDLDGNFIPDAPVQIIARLPATDISYLDNTTFDDVATGREDFDPSLVRYFYAVAPVNRVGLMGEPAIGTQGVSPVPAQAPAFMLATQEVAFNKWSVAVRSTQPLSGAPAVQMTTPNGDRVALHPHRMRDDLWEAQVTHEGYPMAGIYRYAASGVSESGVAGGWILSGGAFRYAPTKYKPQVEIRPNRVHRISDGPLQFYPTGMKIRIYQLNGRYVHSLELGNKWDCVNDYGEKVAPGVYIYVAEDGSGFRESGRLLLR